MKKHLEKTQLSESFLTCCWSLLYRYLFYSTDFNWYIDVLKKILKITLGGLNITALYYLSVSAMLAYWHRGYLSRVFVGRLVLTRTFKELSVQNFLSTWAPTLPTWVLPCRTPRFWLQFMEWELMNFKTDIKLCLIWRHDFYSVALEHQLYARC